MKMKQSFSNCLLIVKSIRLNKDDYWAWFKYFIFGTFIIPIFYILLIELTAEVAQHMLNETWAFLDPTNEFSLYSFRIIELVFLFAAVVIFWTRCHIKTYNRHFTEYAEDSNRYDKQRSCKLCSRCGTPWYAEHTTSKQSFQTGEKISHYVEYPYGDSSHYVVREQRDPIYETHDVTDTSYRCGNIYCGFHSSTAASFAKMFLMPYKITDTVTYAIKIDSCEKMNAGNVICYKHGVPVFLYYILTVLLCFLGNHFNLNCFNLRYMDTLLVPLWVILMQRLMQFFILAVSIQLPAFVAVKMYFYRKKLRRKQAKMNKKVKP